MDFGFHAPTMSFPVPGTLMIEPTESESKRRARSLLRRDDRDPRGDRQGRQRRVRRPDNPLVNAPHTAEAIAGEWPHPYSRELAAYPRPACAATSTGRGRPEWTTCTATVTLRCACPPLSDYEQA